MSLGGLDYSLKPYEIDIPSLIGYNPSLMVENKYQTIHRLGVAFKLSC